MSGTAAAAVKPPQQKRHRQTTSDIIPIEVSSTGQICNAARNTSSDPTARSLLPLPRLHCPLSRCVLYSDRYQLLLSRSYRYLTARARLVASQLLSRLLPMYRAHRRSQLTFTVTTAPMPTLSLRPVLGPLPAASLSLLPLSRCSGLSRRFSASLSLATHA